MEMSILENQPTGLAPKSSLLYHNLLDCDPSRKLTVCATFGRLSDGYSVCRMRSIKMSSRLVD